MVQIIIVMQYLYSSLTGGCVTGETVEIHGSESDGFQLRVSEIQCEWCLGLTVGQVRKLRDAFSREVDLRNLKCTII